MVPICYRYPDGSAGKNLPAVQETQEMWVLSLGGEDPLEEETATHSSILAWKIPWTEEPGGLQSMGSQRVGHDWATKHVFKSPYCLSSDYLIKSKVLAPPSKTHHHLAWPLFLVLPATIPHHKHDSQAMRITQFLTIFLLSTTLISWWPRSEMPSFLFYITLNLFLKIPASFFRLTHCCLSFHFGSSIYQLY